MQPSPRAETSRLLFPSLRFFIVPPRRGNSLPQVPAEREIRRSDWRNIALVLKKSPSWCLRGRQQQGYKQTRVSDAAGNRHSRRLAAYDGATRPFGVAVLLLPHRRSGSSKPLVTFHRPLPKAEKRRNGKASEHHPAERCRSPSPFRLHEHSEL